MSLDSVEALRLLSWQRLTLPGTIATALPEFLAVASQEAKFLAVALPNFLALASPEANSLASALPEVLALASQEAILATWALASPEAKLVWLDLIHVSLETWVGPERALGVSEEGWSPLIVVLAT